MAGLAEKISEISRQRIKYGKFKRPAPFKGNEYDHYDDEALARRLLVLITDPNAIAIIKGSKTGRFTLIYYDDEVQRRKKPSQRLVKKGMGEDDECLE